MITYADKKQENKSQSVANAVSQKHSSSESTFQFEDNRPEAVAQRKLQEMVNNGPQTKQAAQLQAMANNYSAQQANPIQKKENKTGLPDNLKTGMENLSGMSLDDVKVHYNSDKPAQLQAHAYAKGTDIHLGTGQEKHLPHEAWHVVQQKQGRVKPTIQMNSEVNVNDDAGLEKEADVMGAKAFSIDMESQTAELPARKQTLLPKTSVLQRQTGSLTQKTNELEKGTKVKILSKSATQFRVEVIETQRSLWIVGNIGDFFRAEAIEDVVEQEEIPAKEKRTERGETVAVLDKQPKPEEVTVEPVEQKEAPAKEKRAERGETAVVPESRARLIATRLMMAAESQAREQQQQRPAMIDTGRVKIYAPVDNQLTVYRAEKRDRNTLENRRSQSGLNVWRPTSDSVQQAYNQMFQLITEGKTLGEFQFTAALNAYAQTLRASGQPDNLATARTKEGAFTDDYNYTITVPGARLFKWTPSGIGEQIEPGAEIKQHYIVLNANTIQNSTIFGIGHVTGTQEVSFYSNIPGNMIGSVQEGDFNATEQSFTVLQTPST